MSWESSLAITLCVALFWVLLIVVDYWRRRGYESVLFSMFVGTMEFLCLLAIIGLFVAMYAALRGWIR